MDYDEIAEKWRKGEALTEEEKAFILQEGAYCDYAQWTTHPNTGNVVIQCTLWGLNSKSWLSPNSRACRKCKFSSVFEREEGRVDEKNQHHANSLAESLGNEKDVARVVLEQIITNLRLDRRRNTTKDLLRTILLVAPMKSGLPAQDAADLADEMGVISVVSK